MALSDAEVEKQINHMRKFIEQEAQEKAEEILIKAEEEFNIEKGRLLQAEKRKVATYFERKEKQLELQRKIQHSNQLNQARLAVLKARDDHVKRILEEARSKLGEVTKDETQYKKVLQDLIAQGLVQLLESEVIVRCRKADVGLVKAVRPAAVKVYTEKTKKQTTVTVDEENFLSAAECRPSGRRTSCRRGSRSSVPTWRKANLNTKTTSTETATAKNSSPYTMLAGPANIFLDNNFIAKSELSDVSPNEEFTTSLGADQSIRITCQPISVVHGNTGVLTKSNLATYSHVFEVKNTRTDTVGVQVSEQVPLSTDDRIKVAVVEPDLKRQQTRCPLPYGYAVLNDSNNVEWHTTIPPDEQLELRLVYTVEYPLQDDIHGLPK